MPPESIHTKEEKKKKLKKKKLSLVYFVVWICKLIHSDIYTETRVSSTALSASAPGIVHVAGLDGWIFQRG